MQQRAYTTLLVDDDEDDFVLMEVYFREVPECRVVLEWVDTYQKALQALEQHLPDMLFVDYNLNSSFSGLDLVQELKRRDPGIPAFLITAQDRYVFDNHEAYALLDGFINKNQLSPQVLSDTICHLLK